MLGFFRSEIQNKKLAKLVADLVIEKTTEVFKSFQIEINDRFREVKAQIRQLDTNLELLERKIVIKDLNDKHQYGQIHYKLHECVTKDTKTIQEEIREVKANLKKIKDNEIN